MDLSDVSPVVEVIDIFACWMDISGLDQCIIKKA